VDAYLLAGDLLVAAALAVTLRRGRARDTALGAAGLTVVGVVLLAGAGAGALVCAVSALGAAALLLAKLTTARRSTLVFAWTVALGLLAASHGRHEQAGSWVAERRPWVVVFSLALLAALTAAAVGSARLARDPDIGPGGL
jgi:drug/metabolite transporter (DMT)-like permease